MPRSTSSECSNVAQTAAPMSTVRLISSEQKFSFTPSDFQWLGSYKNFGGQQNNHELSKFDKELHRTWDAAVDAGHFSYKLDCMETRIIPGKYSLLVQLNECRFTKRRKPDPMESVSQAFNPAKFNFTKVPSKEVMFELCPRYRTGDEDNEHNVLIINISPLDYGHCLLVPGVNLCQPQALTEKAILLGMETFLLSNHRGFHVGFNSLCAYASVNHLHFHVWYSEYPSYLGSAEVSPVCDDLFEVKNYATTTFVFELRPDSDVALLASKIHKVTSYLVENEVAHTFHIIRGEKCSSTKQVNGVLQQRDGETVVRVFLWPRIPVTGAKVKSSYNSDERPMAVCEFAGFLAVETKETYDSFTEDQFCEFMRQATLPEEEFIQLKEGVQKLLTK